MAIVQAVIDFHPNNRQPKQLLTTVCMSPFKIGSLPSAWPWEIWVRDKTRPTTYAYSGSCNLNTLQRRTHILVGIQKEFTNKQGHSLCASPFRKTVASLHLRQISKKDEGRRKQSIMLGSSPFKKPHRLGRLKTLAERASPSTTNWVLNFSKLKPCVKFFKSLNRKIELNKIHLYFIIFQKFRWTVKFRGKTRPFNVLE